LELTCLQDTTFYRLIEGARECVFSLFYWGLVSTVPSAATLLRRPRGTTVEATPSEFVGRDGVSG